MDRHKLDKELGFLSEACGKATERYVLVYQLIANLLAIIVLSVVGTIALILLEKGAAGKALGFVVGVIALGLAGIVLASGAAAIQRRVFSPPASSYESPWQVPLQFLQRNCRALSAGFGVFYGAFVVLLCILLVPSGAAGLGDLGQILFSLLLIPMVIVAAAGVLSLVVGASVVPAEVALREQDVRKTISGVFANTFRRLLNCLSCLGSGFVASVLIALPIFALLHASRLCLTGLAVGMAGAVFDEPAVKIMRFFWSVLIAGAAAVPMAYFNVIVGLRYREIIQSQEEEAAGGPAC